MKTEIVILEILKVALCALGYIPALFALYEILFGENHSTSSSNKKLIGGVVFGTVAFIVMTAVIDKVKEAGSMTGQLDTNTSIVQVYEEDYNEKINIDEIMVA